MANRANFLEKPVGQASGLRDFRVVDLEGNRIRFGQPLQAVCTDLALPEFVAGGQGLSRAVTPAVTVISSAWARDRRPGRFINPPWRRSKAED